MNNFFIGEEYKITCVIDWAFCSSVPLSVLLTPPGLPRSRDELEASLCSIFEYGFQHTHHENSPQANFKKDTGLYQILKQGRPIWLFSRLISFDSNRDYDLFKDLWDSIGPHHQDLSEFFTSRECLQRYIVSRDEPREEDAPAEKNGSIREPTFSLKMFCKPAISRKLTLISEYVVFAIRETTRSLA